MANSVEIEESRGEKIKAAAIISFIRLTSYLSLVWAQRLGSLIGRLICIFAMEPRKVTSVNLSHCFPDRLDHEREKLVHASLIETGKVFMEMGIAWEWPNDKTLGLIRNVEGEDLLQQALEKKKGVIFLAPHIGNWEIFGLYLSSRFKMAALYQPPKIKPLETYMQDVRGRIGSELVPANKRGVMRLFHILRAGDVLGILPDQEPGAGGGEFAPFFGIQAYTIKLVSKLVARTDAAVLCGYAKRLPEGKGFDIIFRPADSAIYDDDLDASVAGLNRSVENCVHDCPDQYQWEYKRYKRRPGGAKHFYD